MAESSVLEARRSTAPCRFFANAICREGERCKYLHDISADRDQTKNAIKVKVAHPPKLHNQSGTNEGGSGTSSNHLNLNGCGPIESACSLALKSSDDADDMSAVNESDSRESQSNTEPVICKYFQDGCCMFGENCYNRHDLVESIPSSQIPLPPVHLSVHSDSHLLEEPSTSDEVSASLQKSPAENVKGESKQWPIEQSKTKLRVNAPEFIPSGFLPPVSSESSDQEVTLPKEASSEKTWAQIVNSSASNSVPSPFTSLCPYAQAGECPYAEECTYLHGDVCEFCGNACLHPTNEEQRKSHTDECIKQHEREMELAFAVARSKDKQCGVCFEVVVDKNPASEQRFGILPNCNHCFCLACIRKWRQAKQFENKIIRACPECRVTSDFVCPSMYWVDTKEEKDKLINAYKDALSNKQCKYFRQGRGKCPFGNKCFYLHAYPDGTKVDTGPPIRRHRHSADGEADVLQLFLWDFLDERDNRWLYSLDDIDLMAILSGSDDSDSSDIEIF